MGRGELGYQLGVTFRDVDAATSKHKFDQLVRTRDSQALQLEDLLTEGDTAVSIVPSAAHVSRMAWLNAASNPPGQPRPGLAHGLLEAVGAPCVVIAQKLKKKVDEVPVSKAIKALIRGGPALQKEFLSDLQLEFICGPAKGKELPLDELEMVLYVSCADALGKRINGLVSRMIGAKIPG